MASLWFEHVANLPPDLMHPALLGLVIVAAFPQMSQFLVEVLR